MTRYVVRLLTILSVAGIALLSMAFSTRSATASHQASLSASAVAGSWKAEPSGTQQALYAVACFDDARCKAVGADGTLLYTRNGGTTWHPQANPLSGSPTTLSQISCVGHATCYVIGRPDTIMVTHNGGVTWSVHQVALPGMSGDLTDATCVGAQVYSIRNRPALCRLGLLDLACTSASTCLVVGTTRVQAALGDLGPAVFLTTDGGSTWVPQSIPDTAPCSGDCGAASTRVPYPLTWISCVPASGCRAGGMVFIGSHAGWGALAIRTRGPGAPWTAVSDTNQDGWPSADSAVCTTSSRCYGVWTTSPFSPGNRVWLSTDGGWRFTDTSSGTAKLRNGIACPGVRTCYTVGNQGTITVSVNGGPFLPQRSGTSHDLYGVTCTGTQTCVAVGNRGTIVVRMRE